MLTDSEKDQLASRTALWSNALTAAMRKRDRGDLVEWSVQIANQALEAFDDRFKIEWKHAHRKRRKDAPAE